MNLLLFAKITEGAAIPAFGPEFEKHLEAKHHPAVHCASCTAWRLLEMALQKLGIKQLPQVRFEANGKPVFVDSQLHFSLSHSEHLAAALLSSSACAVDLQAVKGQPNAKLVERCLNEQELALGCDFTECWTKKECLGKLSGRGLPSRPNELDSLDPQYADHFHLRRLADSAGQEYVLTALCMNNKPIALQKIEPEEL